MKQQLSNFLMSYFLIIAVYTAVTHGSNSM